MKFILHFTSQAKQTLKELKINPAMKKQYSAAVKALKFLQENPRHPGLQTHQYYSFLGPNGEKAFTAYAEQKTPAAYRIFFYYGPGKSAITIFAITCHP